MKNELKKVNIHEDYCLYQMLINARNNINVLQNYVYQYRSYDNGKSYEQYNKVIKALEEYEHYIALMSIKKED